MSWHSRNDRPYNSKPKPNPSLDLSLAQPAVEPQPAQAAAEKMEAARAGQKAITGTEADLRKLGMAEARERLLELGIKDAEIASACSGQGWGLGKVRFRA